MKKLLTLVALLFLVVAYSQENQRFRPILRANFVLPLAVGDNYINNEHNDGGGLQMTAYLLSYKKFEAGISFTMINFTTKTSDGSGDDNTCLSLSPTLRYRVPISEKFTFYPEVSAGIGLLLNNWDQPTVTDVKAGFTINYKVSRMLSILTGAGYQYGQIDLETRHDLEKYVRQLSDFQFYLGAQLDFNQRKKKNNDEKISK